MKTLTPTSPAPFYPLIDLSRTPPMKHAKTKERLLSLNNLLPNKRSSDTHRNTWINETQLQEIKLW